PTIWRGPMVARMTQQFFDEVEWGELDFLILDLPPGTGDIQLTLVQKIALTGAVIVTTPQELAIKDVQKGADMFRKVNTPVLGIIENMTHFQCPNCDEITQIFPGKGGKDESERLNVPLLGQVLLSPELALATDSGTPYVLKFPDSVITKIYKEISEQLTQLIH
ncbi:MAG: P-loop NTPase, partial [Fidelibacterota bacterium]